MPGCVGLPNLPKTGHSKTKRKSSLATELHRQCKESSLYYWKKSLIPDPKSRQFPLGFHERTQTILDPHENFLQHELFRFQREITNNNQVKNEQKTVILLFNFSQKYAFSLEFQLHQVNNPSTSNYLNVQITHKILGIFVQIY